LLCAGVLALVGAAGTAAPADSVARVSGWRLVWSDEFNGANLDATKWNARTDTYVDYDLACITDRSKNVFMSEGKLTLRALSEPTSCGSQNRPYTVAYLDTIGKASFTYGRFEMRARSPNGAGNSSGLWPAFWLRPDDDGNGEMDVVELPGGKDYYRGATQAIFREYTVPTKQDNRYPFPTGYPGDGFHTYTMEWSASQIRWLIDGALAYERDTSTTPWFAEVLRKPYHLRLNFQVGGWLGNPDAATTFPADFEVDYIRVWQAVTRPGA
jgi:beta-glucanase (GH16 family)